MKTFFTTIALDAYLRLSATPTHVAFTRKSTVGALSTERFLLNVR